MEKNKTKIITIASIIALVILIVGATYAYFAAQTGEGSQTDIRINANTVDSLTFETGDPITLTLDQENFAEGKGNQTGSTFAKAMLTANNKTNTATEHYYMYLNITGNTFTYTQNEDTPEILLTITDTNNNEITSIDGLTYKTVTDGNGTTLKGFDITTQNDLIAIFENREITTASSITEEWNVTVTYVNYDFDQSANAGKSFNAKLMIQKNQIITNITNVCETGNNLKSCLTALGPDGTLEFTNLYYHDSTLANGAGDNSYRYSGSSDSVNNFVCFGTNESPCPTDNLYRIIGVIDNKVKLIKYDYANSDLLGTNGDYESSSTPSATDYKGALASINTYYWNNITKKNTWSTSLLNKTNLNINFINNIGSDWANKIATTTWKVGGNKWIKLGLVVSSVTYQNEIVNPDAANSTDNAIEYEDKIGLMYVSDYGFAAKPNDWTKVINSYSSAVNNNWMYMGVWEWTISRLSDYLNNALIVNYNGNVFDSYIGSSSAVRPVFNLESSVTYVSGSGTQSDPILLS